MKTILVFGAGKIGAFLYTVLKSYGYNVKIADQKPLYELPFPGSRDIAAKDYLQISTDLECGVSKFQHYHILDNILSPGDAIVSCLPHYLTQHIIHVASDFQCNYFDFTEDIRAHQYATNAADRFARKHTAIVPGCGLAPGYVEIVAANRLRTFEKQYGKGQIYAMELMVGGNPEVPSHPSQYGFTWSVDGLVNQYINPTLVLANGEIVSRPSLRGYEVISPVYEAFYTSGGHGQFLEFAKAHKLKHASYRSLRYIGHHQYLKDVIASHKSESMSLYDHMKRTFSREIAVSPSDIVKIKIKTYLNKSPGYRDQVDLMITAREVLGRHRTAMEIATVGSAAQVIKHVLNNQDKWIVISNRKKYQGLVLQTDLPKSVFKDKKNFPELILTEV